MCYMAEHDEWNIHWILYRGHGYKMVALGISGHRPRGFSRDRV
jgi:hypothetical protein